ncbi:MAG: malate synthase A [Thermomicrobiales bacterium]
MTIEVTRQIPPDAEGILTPDALEFVAKLHREFNPTRRQLLARREERQAEISAGAPLTFLLDTQEVRDGNWRVGPTPDALQDRRVEITGPADRKMMINALNCGAKVFMVDFEDALSPTWENVTVGQANVRDSVRRTISLDDPSGRQYRLNDEIATLVVRARGWHLDERHVLVDGEPISASLFDFGLSFFHNAREQLDRGAGPYFYLPKLQSHREARLWNDVFNAAQSSLSIPLGTIRATVLIETIHAAFEMEEILYELREHSAGLNAGRWDYIFSLIKTLRDQPDKMLPDRAQVTMAVPFMRAYTELLVRTCHKRGAHAIGGMAAFIPTRRDPEVNENAMQRVREDKQREAGDSFDGTWIAHPGLVEVAQEQFDRVLGDRPNQKDRLRDDVQTTEADLVNTTIEGSTVTDAGVRTNVSVALQYVDSWLRGIGAAAINNLMEDAATAEISRAQLWQWIRHGATTEEGQPLTNDRFKTTLDDELAKLGGPGAGRLGDAAEILDSLIRADEFAPFLTLPAYERLD